MPYLIADYLATSGDGDPAPVPTRANSESLLAMQGVVVSGLVRKAALITPGFVVAASGDGGAATTAIKRLQALFSQSTPTISDLKRALTNMDDLPQSCKLIGWTVERRTPISFCWDTAKPHKLRAGGEYVEGSGRNMYLDLIGGFQQPQLRQQAKLDGAIEFCLHQTGTLWANEMLNGNTLVERFGGGFDIFVFDGRKFFLVPSVTYLLFGVEYQRHSLEMSDLVYRVWTMPLLTKASYINENCFLRVLIPPNRFGVPASDVERIGLVPALVPTSSEAQINSDVPIRSLPFTSDRYVCCIYGEAFNGQREVFTAVVSGEEAKHFKIYPTGDKKDDLDEIRFEFPDQIMRKIIFTSVQSFERHGTRFPQAGIEGRR